MANLEFSEITFGDKVYRGAWLLVHSTLYTFSPIFCFKFRCFLLKLFGAQVDYGFRPYPTSKIWSPKNLSADNRSSLGPKVEIYNPGPVKLGKDVNISQHAYICSASRKRRNGEFVLVIGTIEIEDDVWIAAKAFVGPNLKIGAGSIIGACTVLTKDTPKNSRATGNPATITSDIH